MKKNVAWALRHVDKPGYGARKRKYLSPQNRFEAVMKEWARGTLRSGKSGKHVKSQSQAIAIAYSEMRK